MKEILENWNKFLNEERIMIFSTKIGFTLKKPEGAAAVIEDTLNQIRGIPDILVVNSKTDEVRTTRGKAYIELEFKFIPRSTSVHHDCKSIRKEILNISPLVLNIGPLRNMIASLRRVQ